MLYEHTRPCLVTVDKSTMVTPQALTGATYGRLTQSGRHAISTSTRGINVAALRTLSVSWFGLTVRHSINNQRELGSKPLRLSFSSKVIVCGHCLVILSLTINKTLKWLSSVPILMQESFWWYKCSDRYVISVFRTSIHHVCSQQRKLASQSEMDIHIPFFLFPSGFQQVHCYII